MSDSQLLLTFLVIILSVVSIVSIVFNYRTVVRVERYNENTSNRMDVIEPKIIKLEQSRGDMQKYADQVSLYIAESQQSQKRSAQLADELSKKIEVLASLMYRSPSAKPKKTHRVPPRLRVK